MATALQVQTLGPAPAIADDCSHWLEQTATPREEAMKLLALVGKNGDTVESIRELIAVPPDIEQALRLYSRWHPEDAYGVERVLKFRKRVGEQFERLTAVREPAVKTQSAAATQVSAASVETAPEDGLHN
jgi:hypothetical protein